MYKRPMLEPLYFDQPRRKEGFKPLPNGQHDSDELTTETMGFIKSHLGKFELLCKADEEQLTFELVNSATIMAFLTLLGPHLHKVQALIEHALEGNLKKNIFTTNSHYFALRRELDDLVSSENNRSLLPVLLNSMDEIKSKTEMTNSLVESIQRIDWPGPLIMSLAYENRPENTLEKAIEEYFQHYGQPDRINIDKASQHKAQFRHYTGLYLQARDALVNHNLRLVFHIAKRYSSKQEHMLDLIQEGAFGLIRAAEKFRPSMHCRFGTYAYHWVDSRIRKARVNLNTLIPIPHDCSDERFRVAKLQAHYKATGKHAPQKTLAHMAQISEERLRFISQLTQTYLSMDENPEHYDSLSLHQKLGYTGPDVLDTVANTEYSQYLDRIMRSLLSDRESYIINERYGRLDSDRKTLQDVSQIMGVSGERIRQIEAGALKKLHTWFDEQIR